MSRTKKGAKAAGAEYWSARPGNRHGGVVGAHTKRKTRRAERQAGKKEAADA